MPTFTFKKHRISPKNGIISYKLDNKRGTGTVYFMPQCFEGPAPETVDITADELKAPVVEVAKPAADPVADAAADAQ